MNTKIFSRLGKTLAIGATSLLVAGMFAGVASAAITSLTLATPNGGEMWSGTQDITWAHTDGILGDMVSIVLSTDSGLSYSTVVASNVDVTDLSYSWDTNNTAAGPLADGSTYRIRVTDGATSIDVSSSDFTVDNTAPSTSYAISPSSPDGTNGWYVTNPTVTLTCTDPTSGCERIDWGFDGLTTPVGNLGSTGVFTMLTDGTYDVVWRSTDNAGNVETLQGPNTVKIDTTAPTAPTITSIADDEFINISEENAVVVVGTAETGSTVSVTLTDSAGAPNSVTVTGTATGGNYSITLDTSGLDDGTITPTVNATDDAGNVSADTTSPTALKDTVAPITSGAPDLTAATDTGASNSDDVTLNNMPDYYIGSCTTGNTVTMYTASSVKGTAVCSGGGDVTVSNNVVTPDGTYDMSFTETDPAGNESTQSTSISVVTDTVAPDAPVVDGISDDTGLSATDGITNDNTLIFNGTSALDVVSVELFIASGSKGSVAPVSGVWSLDNTAETLLDATNYQVTAKATDLAGNVSLPSAGFALNVDTVAPSSIGGYTFDGSSSNAFFNPGTVSLEMGTYEPVEWVSVQFQKVGDPSIYKTYNIDPSYDGTNSATQVWNGDLTAGVQADVEYEVKVHVKDLAGNSFITVLTPSTVTVDTVTPDIFDFNSPVVDTVYRADPLLDFTPSDSAAPGTLVCSYSVDGGTENVVACTADTAVNTNYLTGLSDGRHDVDITVTDQAGNTVTSSATSFVFDDNGVLTVDDTPANNPDFPLIQKANDAWVTGIDTISVADGTYAETATINHALIVKSVNGSGSTFVDGSITVDIDGVTIDGFDISNPGGSFGVIVNGNSNVTVKNNNINNIGTTLALGSAQGIYLNGGSSSPTNVDFSNNTISNIGNTSMLHNGNAGSSAKGIYIGTTSGSGTITGLTITGNTISNIYASTASWIGGPGYGGGAGAIGIMINFGGATTAIISGNTISTLEGLWARGIGLEGNTPNTSVTGNTISDLIDYKGSTDAVAVFAEDNPGISTTLVNNNKFDASNVPIGVALHPALAATSAGVLDATNNWWGDATGPKSPTSNPAGLGSAVWPSVDDGMTSYVDFSPFYNSAGMTDLVSVDPIDYFELDFNPYSQAVNNPSTLTITAYDASDYLVVNDVTTKIKLDADSGASFGDSVVQMHAGGDVTTTITNTIVGTVNVTAEEWPGGPATGTGTIEFIAGSDVTAPEITNIQVTSIGTDTATITWDTDEGSTSQVEYGTTSFYGSSNSVDGTLATTHSMTLTGLTNGTVYHFRVKSIDASTNPAISGDNVFTTVGVDTTPPVITLQGSNPITLTKGVDTFTEPGATANDNEDGNITPVIVGGDTVNTAIAGTYVITYNVSDIAGNPAVTATRTVIVVDPAATPIIPGVTLIGLPIVSSYTVSEATTRFASGLQFEKNEAAISTVNGSTATIVSGEIVAATQAQAITLGAHTYNVIVTSSTGDTANITVSYLVTANPGTDNTAPVITLLGQNPMTLTVGDTFTDPGATANDDVDGDISGSITFGGTIANGDVATTTGTFMVTYDVSDSATNSATQETRTVVVNAAFDDTATLAVTGIDAVKTYATADDTYGNGWSWVYHVTVPTSETQFKMKFSDFISGTNTIPAGGNIQFYTAQASANSASTTAVTITAADTYSTAITLDADLEGATPGRQIDVTVEMKVPSGTPGGSYSGSYEVETN